MWEKLRFGHKCITQHLIIHAVINFVTSYSIELWYSSDSHSIDTHSRWKVEKCDARNKPTGTRTESFKAGLKWPRVSVKFVSDLKALKGNSVEFFLLIIWGLNSPQRISKIIPHRLLNKGKKEPWIKFYILVSANQPSNNWALVITLVCNKPVTWWITQCVTVFSQEHNMLIHNPYQGSLEPRLLDLESSKPLIKLACAWHEPITPATTCNKKINLLLTNLTILHTFLFCPSWTSLYGLKPCIWQCWMQK